MKRIRIFLKDSRTLTFVVCVLLSAFLWSLIRLSKNLLREVSVPVVVTNLPAHQVLMPSAPNAIKLLVEGNGFTLLKTYSQNEALSVDYTDLKHIEGSQYCLSKSTREKLTNTYLSNFKIRSVVSDTLTLLLEKKVSKKIPVLMQLNVEYAKEYQLTELRITPDSVTSYGSQKAIDTLTQVTFQYTKKKLIKDNFSKNYSLKNTKYITYDLHTIKMEAFVDKVSEQLLKVPVQVVNVPKDSQVKVFPNEITVLCTGDLSILKALTPNDIQATADFAKAEGSSINLQLSTQKKRMKISFFGEDKVDFLIRKE
ncbi:YbbR-like domain-containing protein [Capnocytophaga leadbetteri]|uniref:YbbR-like domain-containing protein n=1 Tax=Capnocytophaga leadbetteri TaxID=327575 RepID=UPI0028E4B9C9|nr:YbbR-like domain-containing protein [Capnocytophaga leadbetteri]